MIEVNGVSKTFRQAKWEKGVLAAVGAMFHRRYHEVQALDNICLRVGQGEIIGYIGPNGAGKSTSIKIMSGILTPDSGQCTVMGYTPWKDREEYVRHIGVVFGQRTQLWWDVPVQDSFELLRSIYKIPTPDYKRNLDILAAHLDMEDLLGIPLRQLSLGQRMRCEIAASLLHNPKILFLDEPTIGLDAVSKLKVREFIKKLNRESGTTVILTTHDMNDIEALTDRIALIGKGKILYDGSMQAIRREYDAVRNVSVFFEENIVTPVVPAGSRLISWSGDRAVYEVDIKHSKISYLIGELENAASLKDVAISSRPVEEIIAQLYARYQI